MTERLYKDGHHLADLLPGRFITAKYCNHVRESERRECSLYKNVFLTFLIEADHEHNEDIYLQKLKDITKLGLISFLL